jgi:hypothetical protein
MMRMKYTGGTMAVQMRQAQSACVGIQCCERRMRRVKYSGSTLVAVARAPQSARFWGQISGHGVMRARGGRTVHLRYIGDAEAVRGHLRVRALGTLGTVRLVHVWDCVRDCSGLCV